MVTARIDDHVGCRGHMTVHAGRAGCSCFVKVMGLVVIDFWFEGFEQGISDFMTADTKGVAFEDQFVRMGIMAIGAANTLMIFFTLDKRSIDINFIFDLSVRVV